MFIFLSFPSHRYAGSQIYIHPAPGEFYALIFDGNTGDFVYRNYATLAACEAGCDKSREAYRKAIDPNYTENGE